jgi:nitrate/TMAO reductase-like tetraheme cytochrome c subunit
VTAFGTVKKHWLQPFFFLGRNTLSLIGGAIATAAAFVMGAFWMIDVFGHGGSSNPYLGLIVFLFLPIFFILGLVLIPIGIGIRRRELLAAGKLPSIYPDIDFNEPMFRHALNFVVIATFINFVIVGIASYRGVAYMDSPSFCGTACHVPMQPQWVAYQHSPHKNVPCVECHVGSGAEAYVHAKMEGTRQLVEVVFNNYPRPILAPLAELRPARATCEGCHSPKNFVGDKLLVKTSFSDDEKNSKTDTILVLHIGGIDSLSRTSGIHGHHLDHFEYTATDSSYQHIIEVDAPGPNGTVTQYVDSDWKGPVKGVKRVMDCMDCHNQATHVFHTAADAVDESMTVGAPSADLPFIHKEGLQLIQAKYTSQVEASAKIKEGVEEFYRSQYPAVWSSQNAEVEQAAQTLITIYKQNVFPDMKVTWGTYPNNLGHTNYPGCFRCHDGNHTSKGGKTITNDCAACHNLLAVDESSPKLLSEMGFQ